MTATRACYDRLQPATPDEFPDVNGFRPADAKANVARPIL
jgi:hypothetical protein